MPRVQWTRQLKRGMARWLLKDLIPWDPSNARTVGGGLPWLLGVGDEPKLTAPYAQDVWVYACVRAIASRLGSLPYALWRPEGEEASRAGGIAYSKAYRRAANIQRPYRRAGFRKDFLQVVEGGLAALLARPNPRMSPQFFWTLLVTFLQLKGNAFVYKERMGQAAGPVQELWIYPPWRLRIVTDQAGLLTGWIYTVGGRQIPIATEELIHYRLPNPYSDHWGLGPTDVARLSIETEFAANLFNKALFQNYGQLGGVLKFPKNLTDVQFKRLVESWREAHAGVSRAYEIAVLEAGGEYQDTAQSAKDMSWLEGKKLTREEKAAVYGVPPAEVGIFEYANYANAQVQQKQFWFNTLFPLLHYLEGETQVNLIDDMEPGLLFEADLTGVQALKEELTARVDQASKMASAGWPINQVNRLLDLGFEDVPWGDDWWIPFSQVPARTLVSGPAIEPALPVNEAASIASVATDATDARDAARDDAPNAKDEALRERLWKGYVAQFQPIEQRYRRALREYFYAQRAEVLRRLYASSRAASLAKDVNEILFELDAETGRLREVSRPYFDQALRRGGEAVWLEVGAEGRFGGDAPGARLRITTQLRQARSIVARARARVAAAIEAGLNNPEGAESVDQIAGRIRDVYRQLSGPQAQTIARTETARAYNAGRDEAMDQAGVEATEWLSARDEKVRQAPYDHGIDGQTRPRGEPFSNGLFYPHDPAGAAGNVINCRCVALPVASTRGAARAQPKRISVTRVKVERDARGLQSAFEIIKEEPT